ncbi:MAG: hypothetical protein ACRD68_00970 [Pyrinomonadaceae bacterium]
MRWKLLLISSLLATIVGAGASLGIAHGAGVGRPVRFEPPDGLAALAALLLPVAAITFASIFVYRHTARRRAIQAMATALLATLLTLATLVAGMILLGRRSPPAEPRPAPTQTVKTFPKAFGSG